MFIKNNFKTLSLSLLFLILSGLFSAGDAKKLNLNLNEAKLKNGELQVFQYEFSTGGEGRKKRVIGVMLFNAPAEKLWGVLKKWELAPEFVPNIKYYKTIQMIRPAKKGFVGESIIEGNMRVAFLDVIYTLEVKFYDDEMRHEWRLLSDTELSGYRKKGLIVKDNSTSLNSVEGFGYVEPYDKGRKSVYYYAPAVEVSVPVPAYVERSLVKSSLNDYMEGLKRIVEK